MPTIQEMFQHQKETQAQIDTLGHDGQWEGIPEHASSESFQPLPWDAATQPVARVKRQVTETVLEVSETDEGEHCGRPQTIETPDECEGDFDFDDLNAAADAVEEAPIDEADAVEEAPIDEADAVEEAPIDEAAPVEEASIDEAAPAEEARTDEDAPVDGAAPATKAKRRRRQRPVDEATVDKGEPVNGKRRKRAVDEAPVDKGEPVNGKRRKTKIGGHFKKLKSKKSAIEVEEVEVDETAPVEEESVKEPEKNTRKRKKIPVDENAQSVEEAKVTEEPEKRKRRKKRQQPDQETPVEVQETPVEETPAEDSQDNEPLTALLPAKPVPVEVKTEEPEPVDMQICYPQGSVMAETGVRLQDQMEVLRCSKCKTVIDQINRKVKITGKCKAQFICNVCTTRNVQMYKTGSMKEFMEKFTKFSEGAQTEFWQSVGKPGLTLAQLQASMNHCLEKFAIEQQVDSIAGQYQPLSWYAAQGYDADLIKSKCTDIMQHEIFGDTYRVNIVGSDLQTINGKKMMQDMHSARGSTNATPGNMPGSSRDNTCAIDKEKAERLKQDQKAEMKQMQMQMKKRKDDAGKILSNLTPEQFMMGNLMKSKDMKTMPSEVLSKTKTTNAKMVGVMAECKDILGNKQHVDCSISVKDAEALVKTSALQRDFVNKIIGQNMVKSMP